MARGLPPPSSANCNKWRASLYRLSDRAARALRLPVAVRHTYALATCLRFTAPYRRDPVAGDQRRQRPEPWCAWPAQGHCARHWRHRGYRRLGRYTRHGCRGRGNQPGSARGCCLDGRLRCRRHLGRRAGCGPRRHGRQRPAGAGPGAASPTAAGSAGSAATAGRATASGPPAAGPPGRRTATPVGTTRRGTTRRATGCPAATCGACCTAGHSATTARRAAVRGAATGRGTRCAARRAAGRGDHGRQSSDQPGWWCGQRPRRC